MIPRTPEQIREWLERMNISHALAAQALGLGNPDTVMREYCSDRREPALTTRMHMDLLETVKIAEGLLNAGDTITAHMRLKLAMADRGLIDLEFDTTTKEKK